MKFTKMHGLGNDFIIVADQEKVPFTVSTLAQQMCHRHFGIGADGLVYLLPSKHGHLQMRIFNADGSEAEQCGNAVRCVARYYYERISSSDQELLVETSAGLQRVWLDKSATPWRIGVDMGRPRFVDDGLPPPTHVDPGNRHRLQVKKGKEEQEFEVTPISMGNPHAIIEVEDVLTYPIEKWGPLIEVHPQFPLKTNVEFVSRSSHTEMRMRVWERGVGETYACGSGACASVVALALRGRMSREAIVHLQGGDLFIEWQQQDDHVYMTGPATFVFAGEWIE